MCHLNLSTLYNRLCLTKIVHWSYRDSTIVMYIFKLGVSVILLCFGIHLPEKIRMRKNKHYMDVRTEALLTPCDTTAAVATFK